MSSSQAATVAGYLAALPPERRAVVSEVRDAIRRALPDGYVEAMSWGMISYEIPLARYPDTYNGRPLSYVALAAQRRHYGLYLMCACDADGRARVRDAFARAGKRLDMGKACIRFRRAEDLPLEALEALGAIVAATPPDAFIARHEAARRR